MDTMETIEVAAPDGEITALLARPSGTGPWPGVVVLHDALGFSEDLRAHLRTLAERGYLAIAPNLFAHGKVRCVNAMFRSLVFSADGPPVRDVLAARDHLVAHPECTRKIAVVGFCIGGGFALLVAPNGFDVAAPFYPSLFADYRRLLTGSCPVVASFGQLDPMLIGKPAKLTRALNELGVPHDVKTYEGVTHSFANRTPAEPLLRVTGLGHDEAATEDAWQRIFAFFDRYLSEDAPQ